MRETGRLARFKGYDAEPDRTVGLLPDHPAAVEGRTLFPKSLVGTFESKRFLVPAENSAKIGKRIEKGPWTGFPVFTLTLQERATCPRSCHMWLDCFGNAMQWARRNDVEDPDFILALKAEVITLVREVCSPNKMKPDYHPPKGLVIRLHVLGDLYSVAYVKAWADIMKTLPEVHVFGYTARGMMPADGDMSIATAIKALNDTYPDRWVIRWSADVKGAGRTIVVDKDPELPDVIMCPAAVKATETCSTCALCWNPNAWGKTIAFLRHGIKVRRGGRSSSGLKILHDTLLDLVGDRDTVTMSVEAISHEADLSPGAGVRWMRALIARDLVRMVRKGTRGHPSIYQVRADASKAWAQPPSVQMVPRKARPVVAVRDPIPRRDAVPVVQRKPDAPLIAGRAHAHKKGGWGQLQEGSAGPFDPEAAKARVEFVPEDERARIAAQYLAKEKP